MPKAELPKSPTLPSWFAPIAAVATTADRDKLERGLRRAYALAFAAPAALALLVALVARPLTASTPLPSPWALLLLAAALSAAAFAWALLSFRQEEQKEQVARWRALLQRALQLATAPLVPWLLACAALSQGWGLGTVLGAALLAGLAFGLGWRQCVLGIAKVEA